MARRNAFVHVGLPGTGGEVLAGTLRSRADDLAAIGVALPATPGEMFRAALEIRRDHRAWGLRRKDVEGTWASICRRARRTGQDVLVSQELLATAAAPQRALLVDCLAGFRVHVVVTTWAPQPGPDTAGGRSGIDPVLDRWRPLVRPGRLHVIHLPPGDGAGGPGDALWCGFAEVVGVDRAAGPALAAGA